MMDFLTGERRERQVSITSQRKETRERQTDRQRGKKRKESTSIGIFDWLLEREGGLNWSRSGMAPGTVPYHAGTVQAHYTPGTAGSW